MTTEAQSDLLCGIELGEPGMIDWAIEQGADVNAPDDEGVPPLMLSVMWRNSEITAHLLAKGAAVDQTVGGYTPLIVAAQQGHLECARVLATAGADLETKQEHGLTALMAAARDGHVEIVELLLDAGADWKATTNAGSTALAVAKHFKQTAVVRLLEQRQGIPEYAPLPFELAGRFAVLRAESPATDAKKEDAP
jgi:ankyrin repeat protein